MKNLIFDRRIQIEIGQTECNIKRNLSIETTEKSGDKKLTIKNSHPWLLHKTDALRISLTLSFTIALQLPVERR